MLPRYGRSLARRHCTCVGFSNLPRGMAAPPSFGRGDELGLSQSLRRPSVLKALRQREPGAAPQAELSLERGSARPLTSSSDKSF